MTTPSKIERAEGGVADTHQVTIWQNGNSHRLTGSEQRMAAKFIMAENDEFVERATMSAYDAELGMPTGPVLSRFDRRV